MLWIIIAACAAFALGWQINGHLMREMSAQLVWDVLRKCGVSKQDGIKLLDEIEREALVKWARGRPK